MARIGGSAVQKDSRLAKREPDQVFRTAVEILRRTSRQHAQAERR